MSHSDVKNAGEVFRYCRNCEFPLALSSANYCPNCGQETVSHPPTAWEFLHEFVGHYVALEGKLARTLALLFFRPGELTRRYLAGRKQSYVLPLRLYLTASILFFLVVKILGAGNLMKSDVRFVSPAELQTIVAEEKAKAAAKGISTETKSGPLVARGVMDKTRLEKPFYEAIECDFAPNQCHTVKGYLKEKYHDMSLAEFGRHVKERTISLAPYAMFLFVPVFALLTKLLYVNRRLYYGEHLVYAFHVHAFSFLLLLAMALVPEGAMGFLYLWTMVYFWFAMRRVFGGRWFPTALRYGVIAVLYPILLTLAVLSTLLAAIFI